MHLQVRRCHRPSVLIRRCESGVRHQISQPINDIGFSYFFFYKWVEREPLGALRAILVWIAKRKALPLLHVGLDSQKKSSSLTTCRCIILIAGDSKESLYFGSLEDIAIWVILPT